MNSGPHPPIIDEQAARLFERDEGVERAKSAAFRLLASRPRSRSELLRRLREKHFPNRSIQGALEALDRLGLLDDRAFAREWVERRLSGRPAGRRSIERELSEKGIPPEITAQVLDEILAGREPAEDALGLLRSREKHYRGLDREKALSRMYGLLSRRGFDPDTARAAAMRMWTEILAG